MLLIWRRKLEPQQYGPAGTERAQPKTAVNDLDRLYALYAFPFATGLVRVVPLRH